MQNPKIAQTPNIAFVGGGNMARSIIGGLIAEGAAADRLWVSGPREAKLAELARDFGVHTTTDNACAVAHADVVVLAVKPQVMKPVCLALAHALPGEALVISVAAGITSASLRQWLGADVRLVRCMPNTPSLVQAGASGLYASAGVSAEQRARAQQILAAVGLVRWVDDEALLEAVTAVSGSGPAYFFLFLEAMVDAAVQQGLDRTTAAELAVQTALGAAKLAQGSAVDLAELRRRVTSPGGTTERAIGVFEQQGLRNTVADAMDACAARARQLAAELGA